MKVGDLVNKPLKAQNPFLYLRHKRQTKGKNMPDTTYNGWTNRETWNVNLWLFNDQNRYEWMQAQFPSGCSGPVTAEAFCRGIFGDKTPDKCLLDNVNWKEVAEAINEQ